MSQILSSVFLIVDTDGAFAQVPGNWQSDQPFSLPRVPNYPLQTGFDGVVILPGASYYCEPDSTGEVYVQFLDRDDLPLTGPVLLARGNRVNVMAAKFRVIGVRRSGAIKITAAVPGAGVEVFNNISAVGELVSMSYPVVDFLAPTPGWTVFRPDLADNWVEAPFLAVKTGQEIGFSGELGGSARRHGTGTFTLANFTQLSYGFADIQNGALVKWWAYHDVVTNGANSGGTYPTVVQSYWHPAVLAYRTSAGVTAGTAVTPVTRLAANLHYPYFRSPVDTALVF